MSVVVTREVAMFGHQVADALARTLGAGPARRETQVRLSARWYVIGACRLCWASRTWMG